MGLGSVGVVGLVVDMVVRVSMVRLIRVGFIVFFCGKVGILWVGVFVVVFYIFICVVGFLFG